MAKYDSLPAIIHQLIENINNKSNPEHIRFNYLTTLKNIRECCDDAIKKYEAKVDNRRR